MPQSHPLNVFKPSFDVSRRYVRVREMRSDGFVEFDFAIGEPGLSVELILPLKDYEEFCRINKAISLTAEQAAAVDNEQQKRLYGQSDTEE